MLKLRSPLSDTQEGKIADWLRETEPQSRLLKAVLNPQDLTLLYGNDYFCHLTGLKAIEGDLREQNLTLFDLSNDFDQGVRQDVYRRYLFPLILRDVYGLEHLQWRYLDEPITVKIINSLSSESRYLQFWLRSQHLTIERLNPNLDDLAGLDLSDRTTLLQHQWEERITWSNYRVQGQLLLEGMDITEREMVQQLTLLLLNQGSIFAKDNFRAIAAQIQSLFRAPFTLILALEKDHFQSYLCHKDNLEPTPLDSLPALEGSHFLKAARANRVWNVPELATDCKTEFERYLLEKGCRSLLLIPLRLPSPPLKKEEQSGQNGGQLLGIVALGSERPRNFDRLDASRATSLIPVLKTALQQTINPPISAPIHPAIAAAFQEESERRSLGLPPQPIIFPDVYPFYSLSILEGVQEQVEAAAKRDLLSQFQAGLTIVESGLGVRQIAFLEQLRMDLIAYIDRLDHQVTPEDTMTAIAYLQEHLEIYYDYFRQSSDVLDLLVSEYQQKCDNDHHCFYENRDHFSSNLESLTSRLHQTWESAQETMQMIIPHYGEIKENLAVTLYAGAAIHPDFTLFHLHSLRYEQLRTLCNCGKIGLQLFEEQQVKISHLVFVQDTTVDLRAQEKGADLFEVRGDNLYQMLQQNLPQAIDISTGQGITQAGKLTIVYSTEGEWEEYHQYLRYLVREGWVESAIETGMIEPLPGLSGLKFARVTIRP